MDQVDLNSLNDDNILNSNENQNDFKKQISGLDLNGLAADEEVEEMDEDNGDFDMEDSPLE